MSYTLWSRGRLLGTSELNYRRVFARHRMGDFYPTEIGAKLMPIATGVSPTGIDRARVVSGNNSEEEIRRTSEYADFRAAVSYQDALDLELRGLDGSVIPTEWIDIRDTEFLLSLLDDEFIDKIEADLGPTEDEADDDFDAWLERREEGAWSADSEWQDDEKEFPRYQLQVMLRDPASVP